MPKCAAMSLAYFEVGSGSRPLLLVHGFLGSGRNLTTLAKRLAERDASLRIIVPDLRGHGESPPLREDDDHYALARDLLALTQTLAISAPFEVMGHSLGGRVALALSSLAPDALSAITVLDVSPSPTEGRFNDSAKIFQSITSGPQQASSREPFRQHMRASGVPERLVQWQMLNIVLEDGVYRWRIDPIALDRLQATVSKVELWSALDAAAARGTRLHEIRGGRSPFVSDADAARLTAAGCKVDTLPGVGHFVHVEGLEGLLDAYFAR